MRFFALSAQDALDLHGSSQSKNGNVYTDLHIFPSSAELHLPYGPPAALSEQ